MYPINNIYIYIFIIYFLSQTHFNNPKKVGEYMETELREADFGLDDFNAPKRLQDEEALSKTILMILFGKPGCFPSLPEIGMDIQSLFYKFADEIDPISIKVQLAYQCSLVTELITEETLDVTMVTINGKAVLRIIVPSLSTKANNILVIGITTKTDGSVVYNYELMKADFSEFF